jgi:rod shape-determining protein MreC
MESFLSRYRNLIVLVGVLFAQVLGLALQVKRTSDSESTRLIRIWAVGAVTPVEKLLLWVENSTGGVWHNYLYLRGVRAENRSLKQEIDRMRLEEASMTQDAAQAHRLQELLSFKQQFVAETAVAQVIGTTGSEMSRSVYIDKGSNQGIKRDMAVLTKDGIVGKVLYVYPSTSLVLRIDDQTSGVGAILDKERLQGILRGTPSGEIVLDKVMGDETVPVGEEVLTSGGDGVFPKGLPVGKVTKVVAGGELLYIRVHASANLGRLEEVLVITKVDEHQTQTDQAGAARAADILAQRLPSVPVKPDAANDVAGKTTTAPAGASPSAPAQNSAVPQPTKKPEASALSTAVGVPVSDSPKLASAPAVKKAVATSTGTGKPTDSPGVASDGVVKKPAAKPASSTQPPKPQPVAEGTPQ